MKNWVAEGVASNVNDFNGGDCCGANVNTQYCTTCQCMNGGGGTGGTGGTTTTELVVSTTAGGSYWIKTIP